jgi:AhpD family alkylhydroperoxidase
MAALQPIEYADASPEVRAVYDDIKQARQIKDVNNFWKYLAHDPATLKRTWQSLKEIMAPGALDAVTKEMVYLAVSVTNGCGYCIASHGAAARKAGMSGYVRRADGRRRHGERDQSARQRLPRSGRCRLRQIGEAVGGPMPTPHGRRRPNRAALGVVWGGRPKDGSRPTSVIAM